MTQHWVSFCIVLVSFQLFYFSELTDEMEEKIALWLRAQPGGQVLIDKFRLQITRQDVATLAGLNWLNDEVGLEIKVQLLSGCQIRVLYKKMFSYFSTKIYVVLYACLASGFRSQ